MKSLPETFRQDGFDFRILRRRGRVALLVKSKPGHRAESFEVVLIRERPERMLFGKSTQATESMPSSEEWGVRGWTLTTREDAETRFDRMATRRGNALHCVTRCRNSAVCTPGRVRAADGPKKRITAQRGKVFP